jgi:hypothetical protein
MTNETFNRRIYESWHLRQGDSVIMEPDHDDVLMLSEMKLVGMTGRVIDFQKYRKTVSRKMALARSVENSSYTNPPGIYTYRGVSLIHWEDGSKSYQPVSRLVWGDEITEETIISRQQDLDYKKIYQTPLDYSPLPETEFWEDDRISYVTPTGLVCRGVILKIDYVSNYTYRVVDLDREAKTGRSQPAIRVPIADKSIKLISRGNQWCWVHDRSQLTFTDLQAEVAFYKKYAGNIKLVNNPETGNPGWADLAEAVARFYLGYGDIISVLPRRGVPDDLSEIYPVLYTVINNDDLKERVRAAVNRGARLL